MIKKKQVGEKLSQSITVTGIVLSATPIGEYDKRVVILTKERGKISAFAKGARKQNSSLIGGINPFSFGEFTLYEGRNSYTIQQITISNYFMELRENIEAAYYGFYFMDIANYYTKEDNDEVSMLKLLYQTLRALTKGTIDNQLIRYIYELKAISLNGEAPQVFECVNCGDTKREVMFSPHKGGIVCTKCQTDVIDGISLDNSTLYTLQYIVSSPIEKLYNFVVTPKVLEQIQCIMKRYMELHVDKQFKSLEILQTITVTT
ncbi:MAG: DNA repair protein RecO [Lachnospiraceae bacterium]